MQRSLFRLGLLTTLTFVSPALAQLHVPAQSSPQLAELNSRSNYPLMRANSRCQFVISQSELGAPGSLTKLALRYDGPSFGAAGGTVAQLDVYLGAASVAPEQSSAIFAGNVQGSLTNVASFANLTFGADTSPNPSPFGGPSGELVFVFAAPYVYSGGPLVVELRTLGNSNSGSSVQNLLIDAEEDPSTGPKGGSATLNGTGCQGASLSVTGQRAQFGVISCHGAGFGPSLPVVCILGISRTAWGSIPLPFDMGSLGATGCNLYNDWLVDLTTTADATGTVPAYSPALAWAVPATPALSGGLLQFQALAAKPVNGLGIVSTNNVQVTLGSFTPLSRGFAAHFHHLDADASVASINLPAVFAMRFN